MSALACVLLIHLWPLVFSPGLARSQHTRDFEQMYAGGWRQSYVPCGEPSVNENCFSKNFCELEVKEMWVQTFLGHLLAVGPSVEYHAQFFFCKSEASDEADTFKWLPRGYPQLQRLKMLNAQFR